ncbi:MAG: hypothetical protein LDL50_03130 [Chloroflexi bacterium]|nr:hypothetical protein [Chloroflexota bacterium]
MKSATDAAKATASAISVLHGIILLRMAGDPSGFTESPAGGESRGENLTGLARSAFTRAIAQADEILAKTEDDYDALDAKGLAISGLLVIGDWIKT